MALPSSLKVALKEWAIVCQSLETGRQLLLLRKGGIHESAGEFELEHPEFLLFPTYLHQNIDMLKPPLRSDLEQRSSEPDQIRLSAAGVVANIVRLHSREQMRAIENEHIWTDPLIEMRFSYKPQNPLYLLLIRAYRLSEPVVVQNTPAYSGCKSWVPLDEAIAVGSALPSLDDEAFAARRDGILKRIANVR